MSQQNRTFNSAEGRTYLYKGVGKGGINSKTQNIDICNVHAAMRGKLPTENIPGRSKFSLWAADIRGTGASTTSA